MMKLVIRIGAIVIAALVAAAVAIAVSHASSTPWVVESDQEGAKLGWSVSTAGDVNADGYDDVIVGAISYDGDQPGEGSAAVYLGSAAGLASIPAWFAEGGSYGNFGNSVSAAGDVNGDGYADILVAKHAFYNGTETLGRVYLYLGSATGPASTPAWIGEGDQDDGSYGIVVQGAGDVNGDGYDDALVGAYRYDDPELDEGKAYLYLGSPNGLEPTPAWTAESDQAGSWYGISLGTAGDVNGDGYADVIVGAPLYDHDQGNEGRVFVYYGSLSGPSAAPSWTAEGNVDFGNGYGTSVGTAGDVNADGYDDVIVGDTGRYGRALVYLGGASGLAADPVWTVTSDELTSYFGHSVAGAGDVNKDGYDDVVVGARLYTAGQDREGRVYVYLGTPTGLESEPAWTAESNQVDANYGYSVGGAGDVNGDGYHDVIVGAPNYDNGEADEGRVWVYYAPLSSPPATLGGAATGIAAKRVMCENRTAGTKVQDRTDSAIWDCEGLGLAFASGDNVQTSVKGGATGSVSVTGSVTRMTPSSVFCKNITTGQKVQASTSDTSWDCTAMGLAVVADDVVQTGAIGTAN